MSTHLTRSLAAPVLLGVALLAVALSARPTRAGQGAPEAAQLRPDLIWNKGGTASGTATAPGAFSIVYSPDGRLIVTLGSMAGLPGPAAKLWRLSDSMLLRTWPGPVEAAAFTRDGQLLAMASLDGITFARVDDGSTVATIGGTGAHSLAFSQDGSLLAVGGYDNAVRLYRMPDRTVAGTLVGHTGLVYTLAFSPDGQLLASGGADGTIRLWNVAGGTPLHTMPGPRQWFVRTVAFSPDGQLLASGSDQGTFVGDNMVLWRVADGSIVRSWSPWPASGPTAPLLMSFSPDGQTLASAIGDPTSQGATDAVVFWRVSDGSQIRLIGSGEKLTAAAFSPDWTTLARYHGPSWHGLSFTRLRDLQESWLDAYDMPSYSVAYSPDGRLVAVRRQLWIDVRRASDGAVQSQLGMGPGFGPAVFSADSSTVIAAGTDAPGDRRPYALRFWRAADGTLLRTVDVAGGLGNTALVRSPNGQLLAANDGGNVQLFNAADGTPAGTLAGEAGPVTALAFSGDGSLLASGTANSRLQYWRLSDSQPLKTVDSAVPANAVAFSPDGQMVATGGSFDPDIRLWSVPGGTLVRTLRGHQAGLRALAFAPDGQVLTSSAADSTLRFWLVVDGTPLQTYSQETLPPDFFTTAGIAYSPDGRTVSYVRGDGTAATALNPDDMLLFPDHGGNRGQITVSIVPPNHVTLNAAAQVKITAGGKPDLLPIALHVENEHLMTATFDLSGADVGPRDVVLFPSGGLSARRGGLSETVAEGGDGDGRSAPVRIAFQVPPIIPPQIVHPRKFQVVESTGVALEVGIHGRSSVHIRDRNPVPLFVRITNTGNQDAHEVHQELAYQLHDGWSFAAPREARIGTVESHRNKGNTYNLGAADTPSEFDLTAAAYTGTLKDGEPAPEGFSGRSDDGHDYVVYTGKIYADGQRPWRNNNPASLQPKESGDFPNQIGQDTKRDPVTGRLTHLAIFRDPNDGWNAAFDKLKGPPYNSLSIADAVKTWTGLTLFPAGKTADKLAQEAMDLEQYIKNVESALSGTGITRDTRLDDPRMTDDVLKKMLGAFAVSEGNGQGTVWRPGDGGMPDWVCFLLLGHACPAWSAAIGTHSVVAWDPNELNGPSGFGPPRWAAGGAPLSYAVFFGNVPTSTAPAAEVVVSEYLDPTTLDLASVELADITFGDTVLTPTPESSPPVGKREFNADMDLRPAKNLIVHVNARLDMLTGILTWRFTSIDPTTGQPPDDPLAGFLAPGMGGGVLFTVSPKSGLATGTVTSNQAAITFDPKYGTPPLATNTWTNTIDADPPVSAIASLAPVQNTASFPVTWSGTDVGSGVRDFTIYVSDNGGPYTPWLNATMQTEGVFDGASGHTYAFYSGARDEAGNPETAHDQPDAVTTVSAPVDTSPPTTTASLNGPLGSNGWYTGPVQVTLSAADPDGSADVAATYYTLDGDAQQTYTAPFTVAADGTHTLTFWSVDQAGNSEPPNADTLQIDTTAPAITLTLFPGAVIPANGKQVTIAGYGKMTEGGSGLDKSTARFSVVDDYGTIQPSGSVKFERYKGIDFYYFVATLEAKLKDGDAGPRNYHITVKVNDAAGNTGAATAVVSMVRPPG